MDKPVDLDALATWMNEQNLGKGPITDVNSLSGGTQNIMFRFKRADREYIFRHPPKHPRPESNRVMQREGTVLKALTGSDVPHPGFIAGCWDEEPLGAYFFLMEPINGFNPINEMPKNITDTPEYCKRMGFSHIEAIAALGRLDYKVVGLEGFGKPDKFLERQAGRWLGQIERYSNIPQWDGHKDLGDFEAIAKWLDDNIPNSYRPGILHGDCHIANAMFSKDNGEIEALIDWEMSTIGDPLIDLGWVMATWPVGANFSMFDIGDISNLPNLEDLISHYGENSDRNLDSINWYGVLACYKLGAILEGTYARAQGGKAPMGIGQQLHSNTIHLFNNARAMMG